MKYIVLDSGHGLETAGKRTPVFEADIKKGDINIQKGEQIREAYFNAMVVSECFSLLDKDSRFSVSRTKKGENLHQNKDISLVDRCTNANSFFIGKPLQDCVFISVHCNAFKSVWDCCKGGTEVFYYTGNQEGKRLADKLQGRLLGAFPLVNRGLKENNTFAVLRGTKSISVLIELLFMDVLDEAILMKSPEAAKKYGFAIYSGICEYFNMEILPVEPSNLPPSSWATGSIEWAKSLGISDGSRPRDMATREEIISMLHRYNMATRGDIR